MKKYLYLIIFLLAFFPSIVKAEVYSSDNIEKGSYIIGKYLFNKNKTSNYNGTLTTPMIMLASKSINSNDLNDMIIYFKNSRGKWVNAITGQTIENVPSSFEITCINLDCTNNFEVDSRGYNTYSSNDISNGVYLIGKHLFNKDKNSIYNGTLTTPMIMLASKTIDSNNLSDMIIYYKNSRGKWVNAITGQAQGNIPNNFNVGVINLFEIENPQNPGTKLNSTLTLSETSGTVTYNEVKNVTITKVGDGNLSCQSSDTNVATCAINGTTLVITPKENYQEDKQATITVNLSEGTNYNGNSTTYSLTVKKRTYKCIIKTRFQKADGTYEGEKPRVDKELSYGAECSWSFIGNANYKAISYSETITSDIEVTLYMDRHPDSEEHADNICERHKNDDAIDYESFRELDKWNNYKVTVGNSTVFDDYYLIKAAHDCANKYNKPVVLSETKVYNIYKQYKANDSGNNLNKPIEIGTSTNFNNSTFYIHDETFTLKETNTRVYNAAKCGNYKAEILDDGAIFNVKNSDDERKILNNSGTMTQIFNQILTDEDKYGDYVFVRLTNRENYTDNYFNIDTVFRRSGKHNDTAATKTDSFRVRITENNGNKEVQILDSDKLFWDSSDYSISKLRNKGIISKIPGDKLILENGNFITVISSDDVTVDKLKCVSGNTSRNIAISRSNIEVRNMNYHYEKDNGDETDTLTYGYTGFFRFYDLADAIFKDSVIAVADGNANIPGNSIYGLVMQDVVNMEVNNISMYRIKMPLNNQELTNNPRKYEAIDGNMMQLTEYYVLTNENYWGVTGTNNCKNIVFDNVVLNRIDSHAAILNLTVKNSKIGIHGIVVTGTGYSTMENYLAGNYQDDNLLDIENVISYSDKSIVLRGDYGSTWNGTIKIRNTTLVPNDDQVNYGNIGLIYWNADVDSETHKINNYGYNVYLPYLDVDTFNIDTSYMNNETVTNFYTFLKPEENYTTPVIFQPVPNGYFNNLIMVRDTLKKSDSSSPDRTAYETTYNYYVPSYTPITLNRNDITSSVYTN